MSFEKKRIGMRDNNNNKKKTINLHAFILPVGKSGSVIYYTRSQVTNKSHPFAPGI